MSASITDTAADARPWRLVVTTDGTAVEHHFGDGSAAVSAYFAFELEDGVTADLYAPQGTNVFRTGVTR